MDWPKGREAYFMIFDNIRRKISRIRIPPKKRFKLNPPINEHEEILIAQVRYYMAHGQLIIIHPPQAAIDRAAFENARKAKAEGNRSWQEVLVQFGFYIDE